MNHSVTIDQNQCSGCKACIEICPRDCFKINGEQKIYFESNKCHSCGHCISVCPENAISHDSIGNEEYSEISNYLNAEIFDPEQVYYYLKSIRSTRKYSTKHVDRAILEKLIDLTRFAPTGHHSQNVEIIVIEQPEMIQALKDESTIAIKSFLKKINNPLYGFIAKLIGKGGTIKKARQTKSRFTRMLQGFEEGKDYLFHGAPNIVIFHAPKKGTVPADNCNIVSNYFRIAAHSYKLGTCYIGYLIYYAKYNSRIPQMLKIPKENEIFQVLIVGYPKYKFRKYVARNPAKIEWL
ncbi:MAG: nitroreductase family protein [Candidatus Thorarchaeota archaeon]